MRAFFLILCTVSPALADPAPSEVWLAGKAGKLQAYLWRPEGAGPFPALVYNHGSEKEPMAGTRGGVGPFFVAKGYVVLFPIRRGAGKSEGVYWHDRVAKTLPHARAKAAVTAIVEDNDDVLAGVEWLKQQPYVKREEISVAGCSFGGIESLLTAERGVGVRAVVDFAGGAMSWDGSPPLRERMQQAAESARVPVFFVQAENDFNTTPSKVLSEAMKKKGLPQRMRIFPRHGDTPMAGHAHFCNFGAPEWGPEVLEFLRNPTSR